MRGSGSQFGKSKCLPREKRLLTDVEGIVTQFTVKVHPIGQVWGGSRIYSEKQAEALYEALHDFVPANAEDPKEAIIFTDLIILGGEKLYLNFYFYDGPEPPTTGPLAKFLEIPSTIDSCKTQSYADLVSLPENMTIGLTVFAVEVQWRWC
jgi:hypothetical protein